jgi:hypothetical protein
VISYPYSGVSEASNDPAAVPSLTLGTGTVVAQNTNAEWIAVDSITNKLFLTDGILGENYLWRT